VFLAAETYRELAAWTTCRPRTSISPPGPPRREMRRQAVGREADWCRPHFRGPRTDGCILVRSIVLPHGPGVECPGSQDRLVQLPRRPQSSSSRCVIVGTSSGEGSRPHDQLGRSVWSSRLPAAGLPTRPLAVEPTVSDRGCFCFLVACGPCVARDRLLRRHPGLSGVLTCGSACHEQAKP
jgi:hypothetical protein